MLVHAQVTREAEPRTEQQQTRLKQLTAASDRVLRRALGTQGL